MELAKLARSRRDGQEFDCATWLHKGSHALQRRVFPVGMNKALATKNAPYLVQVALVFTTGLGWEKVLSTVAFFAKQ